MPTTSVPSISSFFDSSMILQCYSSGDGCYKQTFRENSRLDTLLVEDDFASLGFRHPLLYRPTFLHASISNSSYPSAAGPSNKAIEGGGCPQAMTVLPG